MNTPPEQDKYHKLSPENYRYIQNTIAGIILQIRLRDKNSTLKQICEIIAVEARNMEVLGLEYLRDYIKGSALKFITAEEIKARLEDMKRFFDPGDLDNSKQLSLLCEDEDEDEEPDTWIRCP